MAALDPTDTKLAPEKGEDEIKELQLSLPKETWFAFPMYFYHGLWSINYILEGVISFKTHFQAHDTDIILASMPKTGTTWLKALLFSIVNRNKSSNNFAQQHPLHKKNPHELVPNLEMYVYPKITTNLLTQVSLLPRLFSTHMPYFSLPNSIKSSNCKIVYVCRNPLDTFVSLWHFYLKFEACKGIESDTEKMENYADKFCKGVCPWGPYEDHVLGYWNENKKNSEKVFFLEYEGLKKEPKVLLKRLAEFVGCPFSEEEEKGSVIDEIIELCSLKSLKEMEINKSGKFSPRFENKVWFRKGDVGDWTNYLTPSMVTQFVHMLDRLMKVGFSFEYYQFEAQN